MLMGRCASVCWGHGTEEMHHRNGRRASRPSTKYVCEIMTLAMCFQYYRVFICILYRCRFVTKVPSFQVLVSIQSMILISEPMYNEPGYDGMRGTTEGDVRE